ncbi:LysR family transcriptional regulator [Salmonella enterica subsp. enterica serovar Choleraesuis]|nr:LysR family transcriptional regulator [Salmonella enterica subsp. enterica serovar Choleraesuis]
MDLRHLNAFVTVAELLHFGRAAVQLNIAQPALTQQIKLLERRLDMQLFVRDRRHVELTPQGQLLLPEARAAVRQYQQFSAAAASIRHGARGILRVGYVGSAILDPVVTDLINRYRQRFAEIDTRVEEQQVEAQLALLEAGHLDIAIVRAPFPRPGGVQYRELQRRPLCVVLPREHPLAGQEVINLADLGDERWIMQQDPPGVGLGHSALSTCQRAGFTPSGIHFASDVAMAVGLVASGMGVALVPVTQSVMALPAVVYRPLDDPQAATTLNVVWQRRSAAVRAFLRCMPNSAD